MVKQLPPAVTAYLTNRNGCSLIIAWSVKQEKMEKYAQKMLQLQERVIELLEKLDERFEKLSNALLDWAPESLKNQLLDNTDLKGILKIGDTKFFQLKKCRVFPTYRLNGKDYYLENEVLEAIRIHRTN
ncbi:hypothetical protein [Sphingobacterium corticibacterium]|uniref:Uncharacterized protein n=1 Tax=Sphingobacterium corticibacterium TaxID=2484746 RepID=A0A4Q6XN52_9SPHI|nr:hypothetical protein [Sphingobacterium corticibacterium]RZF57897.1 hypothetical protein EWE74_19700 [Sphingobacterium corticibacterium]